MKLPARHRPGYSPQDLPWMRSLLVSVVVHATLLWSSLAWWHKTYQTADVNLQVIEVEVIERAVTATIVVPVPESPPSSPAEALERTTPVQLQPAKKHRPPRQPDLPLQRSTTARPVAPLAPPQLLKTETGTSPESLPERELTAAVAEVQATLKPADQKDQGMDLGQAYESQLKALIERHKKYPLIARKGRQQGQVVVEFILEQNGELVSVQVTESSGYRLLDRAALKAVSSAAQFPAPPSGFQQDTTFRIPISFLLE